MSVLQKSTDGATRRSAATECPTEPRAGGRTPWASRTAPRACAQQAHRWSPRSARSCPYRPTRRAVPGAASGATPAREQQERLSGAQDRADLATGGARARGRRARITQAFPPPPSTSSVMRFPQGRLPTRDSPGRGRTGRKSLGPVLGTERAESHMGKFAPGEETRPKANRPSPRRCDGHSHTAKSDTARSLDDLDRAKVREVDPAVGSQPHAQRHPTSQPFQNSMSLYRSHPPLHGCGEKVRVVYYPSRL